MKAKKKIIQTKSSNTVKFTNNKTTEKEEIITQEIKQKTFATIEQNLRTLQNSHTDENGRKSLKARFSLQRKSHDERMQEHNLSPFSDRSSFSPKYKKTPQKLVTSRDEKDMKFALNLKQLDKKKVKPKPTSARQARQLPQSSKKPVTINNKSTTTNINTHIQQIKKKPFVKKKQYKQCKKQKQEKAHIEFQNQFLSMMNNKMKRQKITELSEEELSCSMKRKPKMLEIVVNSSEGDSCGSRREGCYQDEGRRDDKVEIIRTMKLKIMRGINKDYPNLDYEQKKVMAAIIIIQRLWRQRKVKMIFQHYLTPRGSIGSRFVRGTLDGGNNSTMNLLQNHMMGKKSDKANSLQVVPKKKTVSQKQPILQQNNFLIRQQSSQSLIKQQRIQKPSSNNKIQTQIILPFENESQKIVNEATVSQLDRPSMIKFVSCYREVKLNKSRVKSKSRRDNIFSLKESLSQMCLMQRYYQKIFPDRPEKDKPKNYELFSFNNHSSLGNESLKMNQQSSIELFKEINNNNIDYVSPQKLSNEKQQSNQQHKEQQKSHVEQQQEQVWIRNETTYSQETDSGELMIVKENNHVSNKDGLQSPKKKEKILVDEIQSTNVDILGKRDHHSKLEQQLPKIQITKQLTSKKDSFIDRNKLNQHQSKLVQQKETQQSKFTENYSKQKSLEEQHDNQAPIIPQYSLKSIQRTADCIMTQLMDEFFKQYMSFQEKQCLVKKRKSKHEEQKPKKPKLPGISITPESITQYLDILIPYILNNDRQQILRSLELFHPATYQKCHRVESSIYQVFEFGQEQEDDIYWNIISNEGFFSCLQKFWQENVTLTKENEKFTNFIDLTYKVYNRCITDSFSQLFNKLVLERVVYPWHSLNRSKDRLVFDKEIKLVLNEQEINKITQQVKVKLLKQSFCYSNTGGKLVKKQPKRHSSSKKQLTKQYDFGDQPPQQEQLQLIMQKLSQEDFGRVMKIANDEFLEDQKELIYCVDERYELWAELGESVLSELIRELQGELEEMERGRHIMDRQLTKSHNEEFLETNETLETNYQQ